MKRITMTALAAVIALMSSGCSLLMRSANGSFGSAQKLGPYPGVRADMHMIARTPAGVIHDGPFYLACIPYWAADLPISTVIDTALLPGDLKYNR